MTDESPSAADPAREPEPADGRDPNGGEAGGENEGRDGNSDTNGGENPDADGKGNGTPAASGEGAPGIDRSGPAARPSEVPGTAEPDEFDPTDLGPDPPSVSVPDPADTEVPPELARVFWVLVVTINVAVLTVSVGAMLVGFRGRWRVGGGLFVLGVLLFVRAGLRYRRYRDR